jgi:hypothetical protein
MIFVGNVFLALNDKDHQKAEHKERYGNTGNPELQPYFLVVRKLQGHDGRSPARRGKLREVTVLPQAQFKWVVEPCIVAN